MRKLKFASVRDIVLLILGLALLGHETVIASEPRVALLTIAAAMIGLPATLLADRRFTSSSPAPIEPPTDPGPDGKDAAAGEAR
jgi:hypothetical protein